jgi:hypothetical protein
VAEKSYEERLSSAKEVFQVQIAAAKEEATREALERVFQIATMPEHNHTRSNIKAHVNLATVRKDLQP